MEPRFPLYGCLPRGLGTPLVESLTGFVGRLAVARHVPASAIFEHLVRPHVPPGLVRESLHLTGFLASGAVAYDGLGPPAQALVDALAHLTGLRELGLHTLIPWRGFLKPTGNGALRWRRPKRWCALCLAEWRRQDREPWEPLLWRVAAVQRCTEHRIPFSELCPRCRARQGVVSEIVPFGYCRKCGHPLEDRDPLLDDPAAAALHDNQARWEWWTSCAVGRMLSSQRLVARAANPQGFQDFLCGQFRASSSGAIKPLAQYLDVGWNSIDAWMKGKRAPKLEFFLAVCMRLGADPLQVVVGPRPFPVGSSSFPWRGARPPWPPLRRAARSQRLYRSRNDPHYFQRIAHGVRAVLRDPTTAPSGTAVAKSLGTSQRFLMTRFPDEYARITESYQRSRVLARQQCYLMRCDKLRAAVEHFLSQSAYPSKRRVFERAGLSGAFQRVPRLVEVWAEALSEHGVRRR